MIKKIAYTLLVGIYLLGCEVAVIQMASSWHSTASETAVDSPRGSPAKTIPHLSFPQRRTYVPLAGIFTFVPPAVNTARDYDSDPVWFCHIRKTRVPLPFEIILLCASDVSPPLSRA